MAKARMGSGRVEIWCPGCNKPHEIPVGPMLKLASVPFDGTRWQFNGNVNSPTLQPAVNLGGCHFYLRDGYIEFLSSSEHDLRGRIVDLPDFPEEAA